ncbi:hypothetical protein [Pseudogemmobacter sp. W21_MBD1_M6]|uniref:hypothetical protein n=1 Tax=Pseudogemmobacter sp. W21_MBD1_M6 TaxID=3240271 RepID=UPI003F9B1197
MDNITVLRPSESVRLDADRLSELYRQLGEAGAADVVCRAMEELATRMSAISLAFQRGEIDVVHRGARGLIAIADQVGMTSLAQVSADVRDCAAAPEATALAATLSRLERIGARSLTAIWDIQDLSV